MGHESYLVTGALGCIGSWVVRNLVRAGVPTTVFDLSDDARRMKLILNDDELAQVRFITGDITDPKTVEDAFARSGATQVIHLAGLQVPFCKANPPLGARVNVVGAINVFEAAKQAGLKRVVYASSAAVYGPDNEYPNAPVSHDAPLRPLTHYGVFKQANEGNARVYWHDDGINSIGLRPYVVYGPGRDQGLTSDPTKAMLAAARGKPYHISYGGRCEMQYADDVANIFIQATTAPFDGADVFNLHGSVVDMRTVVNAITAAAPGSDITFEDKPLGFPPAMDDSPLEAAIGPLPNTPLAEGVVATVNMFKQAIAAGHI